MPSPDAARLAAVRAAELIQEADGLLVAAGAGMGVDSGLPDFRGDTGFWRHYPALQQAGLDFQRMASPVHFRSAPGLAWGFYGHRLALYRSTPPHAGFQTLRRIADRLPHAAFVFTSNVDGQFQQAGFPAERIVECHGSIHHLQCADACRPHIWPADAFEPLVDTEACRLLNEPPRCPFCSGVARPNVLMFNDGAWIPDRTDAQHHRLNDWLAGISRPVIIELGAGTAVPTVRYFAERLRQPLIRINPREAGLHAAAGVSMPSGALQALERVQEALDARGFW